MMNVTDCDGLPVVRICCESMWRHLADDRNYEEIMLWKRCPWCDEEITGVGNIV